MEQQACRLVHEQRRGAVLKPKEYGFSSQKRKAAYAVAEKNKLALQLQLGKKKQHPYSTIWKVLKDTSDVYQET